MKTISCNAELTPDGQLILPPEVVKRLNVKRKATRRIIILNDKESKKNLGEFCGKWQDQRDADEIIAEIYSDREKNCRSDKFNL
jgi:bifunctional DNA-binding transcriptional regulator/antitoxin component of YhaV-PrlF toxin-antitoxin module